MVDRATVKKPTPHRLGRGLLSLLAGLLLAATQSACGDACLSLASEVCQCLPDDGTRAACNARATEGAAKVPVRPEDEVFCQQKLDEGACDCNKLTTPEVKLACGFAYPTVP
jgi:hypothetical protein